MTMSEILRRKLMERIDIASEPDDGEVLEEIDRLILGEEETRYLPVSQKAELRRQLFYSVRRPRFGKNGMDICGRHYW